MAASDRWRLESVSNSVFGSKLEQRSDPPSILVLRNVALWFSSLCPSCAAAVAFTVALNMQVKQKHKCLFLGLPKTFLLLLKSRHPLSLMLTPQANQTDLTSAPHHLSVLSAYIWRMYRCNTKRGFIHTWSFGSSIISRALSGLVGLSLSWSLICGVLSSGERSINRLMRVQRENTTPGSEVANDGCLR